jgi:Mrp family chromosome partitioning ATPase
MTSTNRAFIKAYRHDAAQPAPATPATQVVRESQVVRGSPDPAQIGAVGRPAVVEVARLGDRPQQVEDRPQHSTTPKRPLSSFIAQSRAAQQTAATEQTTFFRPGTTVATFHWPAVCRVLTQQCGPQLDNVAELAIAKAHAGRSMIGVMGLFPKRGATSLALCVAARIAQRGRQIILVDGNFATPRLAAWLDIVPTAGWEEALKHAAQLSDAAIHATGDRLDLLALGTKKVKNAAQLVGGLQAAVTAGVLRHAYDIVLVDLGAYFDAVSQPILLELVRNLGIDAVVAVSGPQPTDVRDMGTISDNLGRSGCELLGVIENRCVSRESRVQSREQELASDSRLARQATSLTPST